MKKLLFIITLAFCFFSCEKAYLGEDESNDPINNFELFWDDFDKHYGLFEARGWDWDSIYNVYQPQVNAQTTDTELWSICSDMISYLDDSHTFIYNSSGDLFFASGSENDDQVGEEFSIDLIKEKYLEYFKNIPNEDADSEDVYLFGKIDNKDIGYIYLNGIETHDNDFMDDVLAEIGKHKAIILDIRNNFGGDDEVAAAIAGRFADGEKLVYTVQERNGINHSDFSEIKPYFTKKVGSQHFSKPLIVLTDEITVSAAEILLLHLNSFELVTQIGEKTAGDFSDTGMRRFLPNGWQYQYSIMMFLQPDGTSLDGIGHLPNVTIRNSIADIQAGEDKVVAKAIQYLFDEYGIE